MASEAPLWFHLGMTAIQKKISEWVDAGVIDQGTAAQITEYETSSAQPGAGWAIYSVVGLGLIVLLTGLISVLAANWDEIPAGVKLATFFAMHTGFAAWFISQERFPGLWREAALTFTGFFTLAGIGLIAQIYHLQGDGWQAILMWLGLTFPLTYLAQSRLLLQGWIVGFIATVIMWCAAHPQIVERNPVTSSAALVAIGFGWICAGLVAERTPPATFPLPRRLFQSGKLWAIILALCVLTPFANGAHYTTESFVRDGASTGPGILILLAALAVALVTLRSQRPALPRNTLLCYSLFLGMLIFSVILPVEFIGARSKVLGCAIFIFTWSAAAATAACLGRRRLFDLATFVIALRFIIVYFEVFGSLLATGLGLISAGIVILGVSYLWHRYRRELAGLLSGGNPV